MAGYWRGGQTATTVHLRLRASQDGLNWTSWEESHAEHLLDDERVAGGVVFFGGPNKYLEYELEPAGASLKDLRFLLIDPGDTPPSQMESIRRKAGQPLAVSAPTILSRAEWGCTPQSCPVQGAPSFTSVTHLVVHHTAGANSRSDWAAEVRTIWVAHVRGNGWNDIGYNYLVDPDGAIYEGRAGGDGVLGAHFSGVNSGTMGVALLGHYSWVEPPQPGLGSLRRLLAWQAEKWKLDAGGQGTHAASQLPLKLISGHRDAGLSPRATSRTECPGNGLYAALVELRGQVRAMVEDACPVAPAESSRCVGPEAGGLSIAVTAPAGCRWTPESTAGWIRAGQPAAGGMELSVEANQGGMRSGTVRVGGRSIRITQAPAGVWPMPCVAGDGIVSAAGDSRPVAAGSLISIYGSHLAGPTKVEVNGREIPLLFSDAGQINALLQGSTGIGTARLDITSAGIRAPETHFWVTETVPSIFTYGENRALAHNHEDGTVNGPGSPVRAGGILVVYLTGVIRTTLPPSARIGARAAEVLYLGPTPEFPGLSQANLAVPADLPAGDQVVVITASGVSSRPATVSVR